MITSFADLKRKDIVSVKDGTRLGFIGDIEFDTKNNEIVSIVVFGRLRFFGLLGREEDIIIGWDKVSIIGEDTILVNYECKTRERNRNRFSFFD